jgi:hypothetical protein
MRGLQNPSLRSVAGRRMRGRPILLAALAGQDVT